MDYNADDVGMFSFAYISISTMARIRRLTSVFVHVHFWQIFETERYSHSKMQIQTLLTLTVFLHAAHSRRHHHHNGTDGGSDAGSDSGSNSGSDSGAAQAQPMGILDCLGQGASCASAADAEDSTLAKYEW